MQTHSTRPIWFWLGIIAALMLFTYAIKAILLPFIVGALVAYFFDPLADRLQRWRLSRTLATSIITLGFFGLFTLALVWLVPTLLAQADALLGQMPHYLAHLQQWAEGMMARYGDLLGTAPLEQAKDAAASNGKSIADMLKPLLHGLLNSGKAAISLASLLIISPIVSFYLLRDWDTIITKIDDLLPRHYASTIREQVGLIDDTISGYVRGMVNVILILSLFYIVALSAVGLDYAILIGLLGGIAIVIPYIGTIVSGAAAVGMAYLQFDGLTPVFITLAIFTAGQMLEGYILTPKLVGDKIGLHPLWLIFGMLAGGALFGFVGILLAIPVSAILGVLIRFAITRYKQSDYYGKKA